MLVAAADLFFLQPFPHLKALIVLLPGNGIAESSVAHSYFTPDAGPAVSYPGDGTELDWEYDEERSRYYVRYPDDQ